jgi:hypothetical protein
LYYDLYLVVGVEACYTPARWMMRVQRNEKAEKAEDVLDVGRGSMSS